MYNSSEYNPTHISSGSTTQVFIGKGILHAININNTIATAVSIYDGVASTSNVVGIIKASSAEGTRLFDATIATGLYITTGTSGDYTVLWTQG